METGSPRKIQFTVPLLDTHLDPEAAEQIRRRRPTPATLVASSDQSSPEIDEDRLPNQLYKAALLNSPRQRRKGQKGTPTMKELQFMVEHHLYRQQQQGAGDECSSESCLSDRPSPDSVPTGEELPHDDEATAEAFEKLRFQMEEFSRDSLLEAAGGLECPLPKEKEDCSNAGSVADPSLQQRSAQAESKAGASSADQPVEEQLKKCSLEKEK